MTKTAKNKSANATITITHEHSKYSTTTITKSLLDFVAPYGSRVKCTFIMEARSLKWQYYIFYMSTGFSDFQHAITREQAKAQ